MFDRFVASARPQFETVVALSRRDVPLKMATLLMISALIWSIGHTTLAVATVLAVVTLEVGAQVLFSAVGPFANFDKDKTVRIALPICGTLAVLYLFPAICLVQDPSLAMKITGLIWIMGVQVFLANKWARVPAFLAMMLVPSMVMLIIAFLNLRHTPPETSSMTQWGIAMGFLAIFLYASLDTLRHQLSTEMQLAAAQRDATRRLSQLEEAHRLDSLTGVLNRSAFDLALDVMLQDRETSGAEIAVMVVDLDSFKPINDTYSHDAGDQVLITTAQRLPACLGESGIVGRLGGDEFICAVHDLTTAQDVEHLAQRLTASIGDPIQWNDRTLKTAGSIGMAITGDSSASAPATVQALCSAADQALIVAKSAPNRLPVLYQKDQFTPRMTAQDKQILIEGIASRSIRPFYQPKIHLPTGQIIGFEALARWEHPTDGLRDPSNFIDQIGEMGLHGDFMVSLLNQVVEDVEALLNAGLDPGQVSLNLVEVALATHSGRQDLQQIIKTHPKVAEHLTFEITEDVFIARAAGTIQASITSFRDLGVRIALDDFGMGFASFHHLRALDFDELKIDTSFVAGLGHDPTAEVLVRGFLSIASGLGVSVIAEGVETEAQRRDLINMGCLSAQGFLFSPAVSFDQARVLLSKQDAA